MDIKCIFLIIDWFKLSEIKSGLRNKLMVGLRTKTEFGNGLNRGGPMFQVPNVVRRLTSVHVPSLQP